MQVIGFDGPHSLYHHIGSIVFNRINIYLQKFRNSNDFPMNLNVVINQISLLIFQTKGKTSLLINMIINNVDLEGFISSHRFLKIYMGKIPISHVLKDSMKEISPHNV